MYKERSGQKTRKSKDVVWTPAQLLVVVGGFMLLPVIAERKSALREPTKTYRNSLLS